jgi:DNA mismatch repair protein MutL
MPEHVIHILPEQVASQIAAGEVVERPASALKELIENSLDAGARCVTVEIAGGGSALIAVGDDGCGMGPHDAVLALRRHATSKIRDASDLVAIRSLGFRGEALASIASVSRLELKTRRPEDLSGVRLSVTGGEITAREECAMASGTRIEARDLFFNTPARLKFLKSVNAEQTAAIEVVQRLALGCPGVAFEMRVDGRQVLDLPPATGLLERFRQLYGVKLASRMLPVNGAGDGAGIEGLISLSQESLASARMLYTFVNGRAVRDRLMIRAISNAYATLIPRGRYPAVVLFIKLRPHDVDVNVHPMKAEVRFRRGGAVFENIYRVLRDRLADQTASGASATAAVALAPEPVPAEMPDAPATAADTIAPAVAPQPQRPSTESTLRLVLEADKPPPARAQQQTLGLGYRSGAGQSPASAMSAFGNGDQHEAPVPAYSKLRLIGQLFAGYIALESDEGLLLVDQHAAHERVTFERLKTQLGSGGVEVQAQLVPETLEMSPARAAHVHGAIPKLRALGFDIEPFGPTTLLLKGTPAVFGASGGLRLLADMIDSLGDGSAQWRGEEGFEALLKQLACHGSVRVGRILKDSEIHALLADLDRTRFKTNCPHGRPVHIRFGRGQIERMFRR